MNINNKNEIIPIHLYRNILDFIINYKLKLQSIKPAHYDINEIMQYGLVCKRWFKILQIVVETNLFEKNYELFKYYMVDESINKFSNKVWLYQDIKNKINEQWIQYSKEIVVLIENAIENGKDSVDIDGNRFIDLKSKSERKYNTTTKLIPIKCSNNLSNNNNNQLLLLNNINQLKNQFKIIKNPRIKMFDSILDYIAFINKNQEQKEDIDQIIINFQNQKFQIFNNLLSILPKEILNLNNKNILESCEFIFKLNQNDNIEKIQSLKINKLFFSGYGNTQTMSSSTTNGILVPTIKRFEKITKLRPKSLHYFQLDRDSFTPYNLPQLFHMDYSELYQLDSLEAIDVLELDHVDPIVVTKINNKTTKLRHLSIPIYFHDIIRSINGIKIQDQQQQHQHQYLNDQEQQFDVPPIFRSTCKHFCKNIEFVDEKRDQIKHDYQKMIDHLIENKTIVSIMINNYCRGNECDLNNLDLKVVTLGLKNLILNKKWERIGLCYIDFYDDNLIEALAQCNIRVLYFTFNGPNILKSIQSIIEKTIIVNRNIKSFNLCLTWSDEKTLDQLFEIIENNIKNIQLYSMVIMLKNIKTIQTDKERHKDIIYNFTKKLYNLNIQNSVYETEVCAFTTNNIKRYFIQFNEINKLRNYKYLDYLNHVYLIIREHSENIDLESLLKINITSLIIDSINYKNIPIWIKILELRYFKGNETIELKKLENLESLTILFGNDSKSIQEISKENLPNNLKKIYFYHYPHQIKLNTFPNNLKFLKLNYCRNDILSNSLSNLNSLEELDIYQSSIKLLPNCLPNSLKKFSIDRINLDQVSNDFEFPNSLTCLNLPFIPSGKLKQLSNLNHLSIFDNKNSISLKDILPNNLKTLKIVCKEILNITSSLETLYVYGNYSKRMKPYQLFYSNLKEIVFETFYNGNYPLSENNFFPPTITSIDFGNSFNQTIGSKVLPNTLKKLKLGKSFNQPLLNLPESLDELVILHENYSYQLPTITNSFLKIDFYNFNCYSNYIRQFDSYPQFIKSIKIPRTLNVSFSKLQLSNKTNLEILDLNTFNSDFNKEFIMGIDLPSRNKIKQIEFNYGYYQNFYLENFENLETLIVNYSNPTIIITNNNLYNLKEIIVKYDNDIFLDRVLSDPLIFQFIKIK